MADDRAASQDLSDARLDGLILETIAQRMHSYDTLVRVGLTNLPAGVRVGRDRIEAGVARLDAAGYVDWYRGGGWLAASRAGRNRNLELQHIDLEEIDLRPDDVVLDDVVLDETVVLDDRDSAASTAPDERP